jgi:TonB-linked SusC/RagA family outer membrane protein
MRFHSLFRSTLRNALASLSLVALPAIVAAQATVSGTITGQNQQPITEARVLVLGTSLYTVSGPDGKYTLKNVPVGTADIRVLRVGFQEVKRSVKTTAGQTSSLDIVMSPTVVQIQEVVVTATGEQRRIELGNATTNLNADKIVANSPVASMGDLLVAKAPGVQILPSNMTGGGSRVRVRGTASLSLSNDPIYIIDGVRMTSDQGSSFVGGTAPSRVNDLNPNEIENIEIVKGPSAATLYGTAAANGVIVITTKKGRAGAARWSAYGEGGSVQDKNNYPGQYAILGHTPGINPSTGQPFPQRKCLLKELSDSAPVIIAGTAPGPTCSGVAGLYDSLTSINVFKDADLTPIHDGNRNEFGVQLSGGTETVKYFSSAAFENETGPLALPTFSRAELNTAPWKTPILGSWERPEALQKSSVRVNLNSTVSPTLDLSMQSAFVKVDQRLPQVDNNVNSFWYNGETGPGYKANGTGSLGQPLMGYSGFTPAEIFQETTTQGNQRYFGSMNADWRPMNWMQNHADIGLDLSDRVDTQLCRLGQCADFSTNRLGFATEQRANARNFTANATSSGSYQAKDWLGFKTTVGTQYVNYQLDQNRSQGSILPPGAQTPGQGTTPSITSSYTVSKTLGVFVEEQASMRDRLFLTGAVRTDQNSAFGTNFQRVYYPKAQVSWVASDETFFPVVKGLDQFRLRAAIGASGVQPGQTDALRTIATTLTSIAGVDVSGERSNLLGNTKLRPEKSTEFETGFDSRWLQSRVNVEFTYYNKLSKDALINETLAPSTGAAVSSVKANLGAVLNTGLETVIDTRLLDRSYFSWDFTVNASHNTNKLKSLGFANGLPIQPIINTSTRQIEGYPVNGYWQRPVTWADVNKDGIITPNEVSIKSTGGPLCVDPADLTNKTQICDGFEFIGYSQPRDEVSLTNGFEMLNHKLRINALFDYKGGASLLNNEEGFLCQQTTSCPETSLPGVDTWKQARAISSRDKSPLVSQWGYFEPLQFWRFRELTASYTLPDKFIQRTTRAQTASITLGARNLHVWTHFTAADPEMNYSQDDTQLTLLTAGPARYITARLNLHY